MATVTSVTATPSTVAPGGGTSTITAAITNTGSTATVTVQVDGSSGAGTISLTGEPLAYSVDQTKVGVRGFVVGKVDQGGTLTVGADGASFKFTSS